jgi:hypothetical protein
MVPSKQKGAGHLSNEFLVKEDDAVVKNSTKKAKDSKKEKAKTNANVREMQSTESESPPILEPEPKEGCGAASVENLFSTEAILMGKLSNLVTTTFENFLQGPIMDMISGLQQPQQQQPQPQHQQQSQPHHFFPQQQPSIWKPSLPPLHALPHLQALYQYPLQQHQHPQYALNPLAPQVPHSPSLAPIMLNTLDMANATAMTAPFDVDNCSTCQTF